MTEYDGGLLQFDGQTISLRTAEGHELWSIARKGIAVIGELLEDVTLAPVAFDRFYVFVKQDGSYVMAWTQAAGSEFLRKELGEALGADLSARLQGTGIASRVIWPPGLRDEQLFDVFPISRPGLLGRLRDLFFGKSAEFVLSSRIRKYLHTTRGLTNDADLGDCKPCQDEGDSPRWQ